MASLFVLVMGLVTKSFHEVCVLDLIQKAMMNLSRRDGTAVVRLVTCWRKLISVVVVLELENVDRRR